MRHTVMQRQATTRTQNAGSAIGRKKSDEENLQERKGNGMIVRRVFVIPHRTYMPDRLRGQDISLNSKKLQCKVCSSNIGCRLVIVGNGNLRQFIFTAWFLADTFVIFAIRICGT